MSFLGAVLALAAEQVAPLYRPSQAERLFGRYAGWLHDRVNAGSHGHGLFAWAAAVLPPALAVALVGDWLDGLSGLLGLAWAALVLYRCMGFRQYFDQVRSLGDALLAGDPGRVSRSLDGLAVTATDAPAAMARAALDGLFRLALARLFGVLFWFVLLGPFGTVAYTLTRLLAEAWQGDSDFHSAVGRVAWLLDWLPARLLAVSFALVGNFEEATMAWRSRAADDDADALVRAAGRGALGLDGEAAGPEYVAGTIGLLNRAVLLWLGVLGLLWLGGISAD